MVPCCVIFLLGILPLNDLSVGDSTVRINATEVNIRPGDAATIKVAVKVREGYHIQAHKVDDEFLVPTTIVIVDAGSLSIVGMKFPPGKKFKLEGSSDFLYVYDGNFRITIFIKASQNTQKRRFSLRGKLNYQACDVRSCLRPRSLEFVVPIRIR